MPNETSRVNLQGIKVLYDACKNKNLFDGWLYQRYGEAIDTGSLWGAKQSSLKFNTDKFWYYLTNEGEIRRAKWRT